ncbi:MAG: fibronectin type III domain-containing protein [Nitrospirota bacterium]
MTLHTVFIIIFLISLSGCRDYGSSGKSNDNTSDSATLTWDAVSTRADGTPLNDLAGYKIYYGKSSRSYTEIAIKPIESTPALCRKVDDDSDGIPDRTECKYTFNNLSPGIYYFSVTAYDSSGNESIFSNEVSRKIVR